MQHYTIPLVLIPPSIFPIYTVEEVSRDQILALSYTPYDLDAFKIYIIDDTVNKLVMFNITDPIQDIPSAYLTVADTDNPARWHIHISSQLKADKFVNYYIDGSYFNSFLSIVLTANVQFDNKFEGFQESYKDGTVLFIGLKSASQII
ncbi:MAG: hypothetical protein EZS28_040923 [Streblomastix strix]|uniref:Uncharacterized protein n=1 Tax=Streblomastix strix TaxID=222440 RepID=A0A5J4U065_9EUKA|nr:MAG: hypothetical protein EZS28_040923 [Streblomastix strix]